ncbi:hypothetical protein BJV82DRAFT_579329 [Fennellomyces sp. T-0311]|nr:hypothetical protein BJV82DRAFT_579329 [Fennellomyces sp. T-0311]
MRLYLESKYCTIRPTKFDNNTILNDVNRYHQTIGYDQYQPAALHERYHQWLQASEASMQEFTLSAFDLNGREKLALDIAQLVMQSYGDCYPTHYYGEAAACLSSRSPILPLSLTEDCDECIILSVLFDCVRRWVTESDNGDGYQISFSHAYLLPVLRINTDNETYRVVGTILVRLYQGGETPEEHKAVLDEIFVGRCVEPKHFIIK